MEVKIWKDPSDGTTRVRVYQSSPDWYLKQRFRLYPPNYNGNNPIDSPESSGSLTWEFCMEKDYYDSFIGHYSNSAQGSFDIALEKRDRLDALPWAEEVKLTDIKYEITANNYTSPTVEYISVMPTAQLLNDPGLYVQGKNGVLVNFTPIAKAGTSIAEAYWYLSSDAKYPSGSGSPNFVNTGRASIRIVARDMRGITTEVTREIDVYPYYAPSIAPGAGEVSVVAKRVEKRDDDEIIFSDAGQSVLVKAKKSFAPLNGKNYCTLSYSRREATTTSWGEAKELVTKADDSKILEETYSKEKAYYIRLTVADAFESRSLELAIPDERVFMDRSGNMNSIAFGGHVTERDAFEVYFDAYLRGGFYLDNPDTGERYKVTIGADGHLIATKEQTTFTLRR